MARLAAKQNRQDAEEKDLGIVVGESRERSWPAELVASKFGKNHTSFKWYFLIFLKILEAAKPKYRWKYFFIEEGQSVNEISKYPIVTRQLEGLFQSELGACFTEAQLNLLITSQIVAVAIDKESNSISGYSSSSYIPRDTVHGIDYPLSLGNHCVISSKHQKHKLGMFMAAISIMHGQKFLDLFREVSCVLRTNNKHVYLPMSKTGPTFRSDRLARGELSRAEEVAKLAITYMHNEVFNLRSVELPFDRPIDIEHKFDPEVTIDGVKPDQIIYVYGSTKPSKGICKLLFRKPKKN